MARRIFTGRRSANEDFEYSKELFSGALAGDMILSIVPATLNRAATTDAFTRDVVIEVRDSAGNVHEWLNKAFATSLAVSKAGTNAATIPSTTLTLVNGRATVTISATGTWVAGNHNTLTVSNLTIAGYTVTGGTSVETIV